jgi:hypothetical protein
VWRLHLRHSKGDKNATPPLTKYQCYNIALYVENQKKGKVEKGGKGDCGERKGKVRKRWEE